MAYRNGIAQFARVVGTRLAAPERGLRTTWFDGWHGALDEALQSLPENDTCPHELFRLLVQAPSPASKRTALITERGVPVAVAGLRRLWRHSWEPVTTWIIPGVVFPAQPGYLIPALEALGVNVRVAWWRMEGPPPLSRLRRTLKATPTHGIRCSDDFEGYWRQSGNWSFVRQCRKRCRDFTFAVNAPGAAEWTLTNWAKTWGVGPAELSDRLVAAKYLENHGRYHSFLLLDQGVPVAGRTRVVHGKDLVALVTYRDRAYDWYGVGTRLNDLAFQWAAQAGFEQIDLGEEYDYKVRWAPQDGQQMEFTICPEHLWRAKQAFRWVENTWTSFTNWFRFRKQRELNTQA